MRLPAPAAVAQSLVADWPELAGATLYTLMEILLGFALSVIVGIGLAVAIVGVFFRFVMARYYRLPRRARLVRDVSVPSLPARM